MALMVELSESSGVAFLVVTHDPSMLHQFDRVLTLVMASPAGFCSWRQITCPPGRRLPASLGLTLAWRVVCCLRRECLARFVTWVSLIGLVLGVAVLTLVVNVMNGFDHELRQRLLGSIPHISIAQTLLLPPLRAAVGSDPQVQSVGKYYQGFYAAAGARTQPVRD